MSARLAIETREVAIGLYHSYLVYQSDTGQVWEALHGFSGNEMGGGDLVAFYTADLSDVSNSLAENDERGSTTAELNARGNTLIETGQEATDLWNIMKQQILSIQAAPLEYELSFSDDDQNSNATVASLLHSVGLDINDYLPLMQSFLVDEEVEFNEVDSDDLPGYANLLLNVATSLVGSAE